MGSPVSAVVTNLYMEFFEELALQSALTRPRLYVDDTCCIVQRDAVKPLLHHLNDVRPTIKFTMEPEKDGSLPFLDIKLTRREHGTLNVTVFRKHADTYGQVLALQLPPSSKCKEGSRQESLRQG